MSNFAVIPARGGSKGIPKKNIATLAGFPLIFFTIQTAKQLCGSETYVSTDDEEIATVAKSFGVKVLDRPKELATDASTDGEWVRHAFDNIEGDNMIILRTTTPFRCMCTLLDATALLEGHPDATGLRSAHAIAESPYKMVKKDGDFWKPFMGGPLEVLDLPRQTFDKCFHPNGYIDIVKRSAVEKAGDEIRSFFGDKILAFETEETIEIDTPADLERAEIYAQQHAVSHWEQQRRALSGIW